MPTKKPPFKGHPGPEQDDELEPRTNHTHELAAEHQGEGRRRERTSFIREIQLLLERYAGIREYNTNTGAGTFNRVAGNQTNNIIVYGSTLRRSHSQERPGTRADGQQHLCIGSNTRHQSGSSSRPQAITHYNSSPASPQNCDQHQLPPEPSTQIWQSSDTQSFQPYQPIDYNRGQPDRQRPTSPFLYSKCTGRKKALCIGINYLGQRNELRGCINDARRVRDFLIRHCGYKRSDIVLLTDDGSDPRHLPTRQNIIQAIQWLVRDSQPDDSFFFHFSGHGGPSPDRDEEDLVDEVIYPVDFKQNGYITDDEIHDIMVKPLPRGCRLTALFDSCHSRAALGLPYIYTSCGRLKDGHTAGASRRRASPADVISLSGCKDTKADTFTSDVAIGAMSRAFITALKNNPKQSYLALLNSIRPNFPPKCNQKAQLTSSHHIDMSLCVGL